MYRKDLSADTIQFSLERNVSESPTVCGRMCGLYDRKGDAWDPWGITRKYASYIPLLDDRNGSHTISAANIQTEYRVPFVGGSIIGIRDCESKFVKNCADDLRRLQRMSTPKFWGKRSDTL